jgi:hypothetical protein
MIICPAVHWSLQIPDSNDGITDDRDNPKLGELRPDGQQRAYLVLSAEERAKGFVRPLRTAYIHTKCGALTTMSRPIAETYAANPYFYGGTFCVKCGAHFSVGEDGEFVWDGTDEKVGT